MSSTIAVAAAGPEHLAGLEALFEAAGTPCYCRYYHFEGTNNEWLARCSDGQGENRREFAAALAARTDEARGVVALAQGATDVIGWLKVAPAAAVAKAYERRLYRGLPCFAGDRAGVFLIGCAVVHPRHRRQGVATALVAGAVELAPAWGARALEALPRRPREPVSDEELWTGPASAFTRNGFVEVHTFEPYPVLRRTL
ncbi:GNAT family N-acetyltransferase [Sorangium cellulosum]|uniref:GNAT family N-acetyltransferase n=1 Tax=Sorangium cellulosum TaxID=56 RepID=UPI0004078C90|nr:GNAT family N-acetyltransferase [Sorangium cellulosum]